MPCDVIVTDCKTRPTSQILKAKIRCANHDANLNVTYMDLLVSLHLPGGVTRYISLNKDVINFCIHITQLKLPSHLLSLRSAIYKPIQNVTQWGADRLPEVQPHFLGHGLSPSVNSHCGLNRARCGNGGRVKRKNAWKAQRFAADFLRSFSSILRDGDVHLYRDRLSRRESRRNKLHNRFV